MQHTPSHWVHDLSPFLIRFWGDFGIRYYGLSYALGFIIAFWMLGWFRRNNRSPLSREQEPDLMMFIVIGTLLGGRLGFMLLYDFHDFIRAPWIIVQVWHGGMASHGAILGIIGACAFAAKKFGLKVGQVTDITAPLAPPGVFLGRVANFINGELWGRISEAPWAVIFPRSAPPGTPVHLIPARHPSQLYEAFLEGIVVGVYMLLRLFRSNVTKEHPGQLTGEFLVVYGVVRILGEQFRQPDAALIMGVSRGIFYSVFALGIGLAVILLARGRKQRSRTGRRKG